MRTLLPLLCILPLAWSCRVYESVGGAKLDDTGPDAVDSDEPDTTDTGEPDTTDTGELDPAWDTAMLSILSPASGAFVPMEEDAMFEAVVVDADGDEMDWDAIDWSTSADAGWAYSGTSFSAPLEVGNHDITASTRLPNGDRLAMTVGDVLVQSVYAGTYTGTVYVEITIEYKSVPYTVSCAGATTIIVDREGEAAVGDSTCLVSLMGYDMDLAMSMDTTNDDGALDGQMAVSMVLFDVGIAAAGTVTQDGQLELDFADDVYGYAEIAGSVSATRLSRDTELAD
jgi:hypothetical protein